MNRITFYPLPKLSAKRACPRLKVAGNSLDLLILALDLLIVRFLQVSK